MSITYTPTTNFGAKDSLPANDPAKVIKGAEFTTEFTAIQSAFALAAPAASPTITGTATFDDVSITNGLTVDGTTLVVDDTNNRVGIGTSSPSNLLTLGGTTQPRLLISANGDVGASQLNFGDASDTDVGRLRYDHSDDSMSFFTSAIEAMRITSSGRVGIGTSSPDHPLTVSSSNIVGLSVENPSANSSYLTFESASTTDLGNFVGVTGASPQLQFGAEIAASFLTGGTERMRITSSGNVGIGTTAPLSTLDVSSARNTTLTLTSSTNDAGYSGQYYGKIDFNSLDGSGAGSGVPRASIGAISPTAAGSAADLTFSTGSAAAPTERMRITSTGNVGIGTSSPVMLLDMSGPRYTAGSFNTVAAFNSTDALGTDVGAFLALGGKFNSTDVTGFAAIGGVKANATSGNIDGEMVFSTRVNSGGQMTERARIDSSGNLLVGTSSTSGKCNIGGAISAVATTSGIYYEALYSGVTFVNQEFTAPGAWRVRNSTGGVDLGIGSTAWTAASDETLKENISDIGPVLDTIKDFQCVNYSLKATESEAADKVGFIAQDWEHTFPNVVDKDEDGKLSMRYTETIPVLLKAIQELKAEVEALKNA